jgi:aerobic carbon-monoxide dehydrogenase medium subunit
MYPARPAPFDYHRAASLDEALSLLADLDDAKALAGGHSLLPLMKVRLASPAALVDIGRIPGLAQISANGELTIGALATHADVAGSEVAIGICPVIPETARQIGDRLVRNRGTIGGSVAHADPASDYPTVLKALGATIVVTGRDGERGISADEFFVDVFTTALQPGELVTSVRIPATGPGRGAAYVKHRHPASSYAVVGVAASVAVESGDIADARLVVGGATGTPVTVTGIADPVAAEERVRDALTEPLGDVYASGEYRAHLAGVLAKRALTTAVERAAG